MANSIPLMLAKCALKSEVLEKGNNFASIPADFGLLICVCAAEAVLDKQHPRV
jgi:hypothetical protein